MRLPFSLLTAALLGAFQLTAPAQTPSPTKSPAVTSSTLDQSEVRITYGELKRLVAATLPPSSPPILKPPPLVPASLMSSVYRLDASKGALIADLQAENFDGLWHAIPIAGATAAAMSVQPPESRLVVHEENLCLITDKAGPAALKLTFPLAPEGQGTTIALAPAAVSCLELTALPAGKILRVMHGGSPVKSLTNNTTIILPASGGEVTFTLDSAHASPPAAAHTLTDDALITTAAYQTEVVRDGSVFTEGAITVRHDLPVCLLIQIPEAAKLLQCHVNGAAVRPVPSANADAGASLEIPLDDPATDGAESEVKLSFTSAFPALQTAEGEITLALPQTPLFARQIDWSVQMPAGYDLTVTGNIEQLTDATSKPPGLHLRKSLCRNQQPQARITYRKH